MSDTSLFQGFRRPTYTMVPDEIFDDLMPGLTGSELKVLLYIVRRTFGFKKDTDAISIAQMVEGITTRDGRVLDRGTGLTKKSVLAALAALEDRHIITAQRRQSAEKGHEPTLYCLNVLPEARAEISAHPLAEKLHQGGSGEMTPSLGGESTPSPWGKNHHLQETVEQQNSRQEAPLPPQRGERPLRRRRRAEEPANYSQGAYGVCPECGMKPHDPECPVFKKATG